MEMEEDPRAAAFLAAPWTRVNDSALGPSRGVPTMLSPEEQKLYYWMAAVWAEGAGEVVDLGCFVGGSTARLAHGLKAAALASGVHAFDRFTAHEQAKEGLLYPNGIEPFEGEDILPLAKELLAPWQDRVTIHRGEIDRMDWGGGPIEILVMDASKKAATTDRMTETFLPHLLPGRSLLVQQDFLHWRQPWLPVQMELLAEYFCPVAHVPRDTLVYLCTKRPDPAALAAARTASLDDETYIDLIRAAQARYDSLGWQLTDPLERMVLGLRANPGKRAAHAFERP